MIQDYSPQDGKDYECQCARCGSSCDWQDCEQCDDGFDGHDCGEDTCCCLYPEENVVCYYCGGHGGRWWCLSSKEYCENNPLPGREGVCRGSIEWYAVERQP